MIEKKHIINLALLSSALFISLYAGLKLNIFLTSEDPYSFRVDNFWAFSSSIFRRALNGELIYRINLATGHGIYIYSLFIWITFLIFLYLAIREIKETLTFYDLFLLLISPALLLYRVDSEIFALLPFLTLLNPNKNIRLWGTIALIIISTLFKEISFLFFLPVLLYFFINGNISIKVTTFMTSLLLISFLE